jgi:hypothetical protein
MISRMMWGAFSLEAKWPKSSWSRVVGPLLRVSGCISWWISVWVRGSVASPWRTSHPSVGKRSLARRVAV